jgi:protein ImuB
MPRLACLYVPLFPLAARLRSEPDLKGEALAIVEGSGNNAHVLAATRRARVKGVRPGQSLAQARSLVPKLIARARDRECERTAQEALIEAAETFSPRIEDAGGGIVFFDVSGLERHFSVVVPQERGSGPAATHEHRIAAAAIQACDSMSLPARCGIAASKLAARVAAELPNSPTIVDAGKEIEFLAPLPIARLSPEVDAAMTIARWGLASIGDFAKLPESEVASRLGELGRELHYAARGIDPRPLTPRALPPEFREGLELEWPLVALEAFLFIANAALDRLAKRMEMQGFACRRLELTLMLEPDGFHSRAIELPAPTRDVKTMLTLLRLDLEKTPPGAPVVGFSIVAHPDRPRRAQLSLFGPSAISPEKLATAIARLISLLGEDRVGAPQTVDGHLPDRFAIGNFAPPPPPDVTPTAKPSRACTATRVFRPPLPLEVILSGKTIESVRSDGEINGRIVTSAGPWSVEEGWWRERSDVREYWEIELESGGVYRVYENGGWFADARYD